MPDSEVERLKAEITGLRAELEGYKERERDLEESRRAMLYMLEDLNESSAEIDRARREWEATFNGISWPVYLHDSELKVLRANTAYIREAGLPLDEIIGRPYYEVFPPSGKPTACCRSAIETGSVAEEEVSTESDRTFKVKYYPIIDEAGKYLLSVHIMEDITENNKAGKERTKLEEQLRQAQKMEAIGTLAGGIAHDFNNILTAIIGFGEIVMEQLEPGSRLSEDQDQVLKGGQRAKELVKQILTFSRRTEHELQPLLIQFLVKEALKLLRASIPTNIEFRVDIDGNCGLVMADPGQIHQVVMNLCTNAYQAMREKGGVLTVSLRNLMISEQESVVRGNLVSGHYVVLEVGDTGCGMSRAVRERIFEPYFTTKAKGEGTGLGLALVHGIVTGLGGVINVYSEPGLGTTFKVYLPLIAGTATSESEEKSEVAPGGNESVMIVDDEEVIAHFERKVLEGLGYRVTVFSDSEAALRAFRDNPGGFDLLLTDMTMPGLTGAELAREILRLRPEMPIILCTGFSAVIDAEKAKALGISEFLVKPVEKGELAKTVRRALAGPPKN